MKLTNDILDLFKKKDNEIKEIDLSGRKLSDDEILELADLLEQHPHIKSVNLSNNNIGDIGAKALATLELTNIDLSRNKIGDEGAICIFLSKKIKNKKLGGNNISPKIYSKYSNVILDESFFQQVQSLKVNPDTLERAKSLSALADEDNKNQEPRDQFTVFSRMKSK